MINEAKCTEWDETSALNAQSALDDSPARGEPFKATALYNLLEP